MDEDTKELPGGGGAGFPPGSYTARYLCQMKESIRDGIDAYVSKGRPPGGFLTAVICNDLWGAFSTADGENRNDLFRIVRYLHEFCPSACWGSKQKMQSWMDAKHKELAR